jgi:hypothetical protein
MPWDGELKGPEHFGFAVGDVRGVKVDMKRLWIAVQFMKGPAAVSHSQRWAAIGRDVFKLSAKFSDMSTMLRNLYFECFRPKSEKGASVDFEFVELPE